MAHVRIKRLAAGDAEDHGAEQQEAVAPVFQEKPHGVARIHGREHARVRHDPPGPERRDGHEPDERDGPEDVPDARRAALLHEEQREQNGHRERHDRSASASSYATSSPSTAESTEIAGVMTPSP